MLRLCAELLVLLLDRAGNPGSPSQARARSFNWHQCPLTLSSLSLLGTNLNVPAAGHLSEVLMLL